MRVKFPGGGLRNAGFLMAGLMFVAMSSGVAAAVPAAATNGLPALSPVVRVGPRYPAPAVYKGYQGTVRVCFTVTAKGTVTDLRRTGYPNLEAPPGTDAPASATTRAAEARTLLGRAAVATLQKWRFVPRKKNGKAVATPNVCQNIAFHLARGPAPGEVAAVQKAAAAGSASAQLKLSGYYFNGRGVKKDRRQALQWAHRAADQGNAFAQAILGMDYMEGKGTSPSVAKAVEWIRKAAAQGNALGEWLLGTLYERGKGVALYPAKAVALYRKSAAQGNAQAETSLGFLYALGKGVPKDCQLAFYWFVKAKSEGSIQARNALEIFARKGNACYVHPT